MFSVDDPPAIFTYLAGMIVLVMVAVGLSLVIDKRKQFATGSIGIQQEIILADAEIDAATAELDIQVAQFGRSSPQVPADSQTSRELDAATEIQRQRQVNLGQQRDVLRVTIASIEQDFTQARSNYRRKTWNAAVGESLGDLSIRGGQVYRRAVISQVTNVGLEIRHEHGLARVQGPDLDIKLQQRFQWDDEKRLKSLDQEDKNREPTPVVDGSPSRSATEPEPTERALTKAADESAAKLNQLRTRASIWRQKVGDLRSQKAEADTQANYGNNRSVPGSLETWAAKAGRLGRDLAKAREGLRLAKAKLAEIAPSDLLLREEED